MGVFTDKDKGWNKLMTRFTVGTDEVAAFAGYLRSSGEYKPKEGHTPATPITMASLAAVHEFGAEIGNGFGKGKKITIPQRSFIRSAMNEHSREFKILIKKVAKAILAGKITREVGLGILAQKCIDWIKDKIDSNIPPPNSDATIARKGSSHTLIDTGQMRNSLDWEIKKGKGTK